MDLILWRHAQAQMLLAEDGESPLPFDLERDLARALTPKGLRQAERMAEWLNQRLPDSTRVLVSPAVRTQQTAAALGRKVRTLDALNPLASVEDLLAAARWPSSDCGRFTEPGTCRSVYWSSGRTSTTRGFAAPASSSTRR